MNDAEYFDARTYCDVVTDDGYDCQALIRDGAHPRICTDHDAEDRYCFYCSGDAKNGQHAADCVGDYVFEYAFGHDMAEPLPATVAKWAAEEAVRAARSLKAA